MSKTIISILVTMLFLAVFLCGYLYMSINKLERSYNAFIVYQLLLLEKNDINGSQSLMSSYITNALISINKNNEFANYRNLCSNWNQLEAILLKQVDIGIANHHLSSSEKIFFNEHKKQLGDISKKINSMCKN